MLRSNSSWVSAKKPNVTSTSWTIATKVETPNCHSKRKIANRRDAEHREQHREHAVADQLVRNLARHRILLGEVRAREVLRKCGGDLGRRPRWSRRRRSISGSGQADRHDVVGRRTAGATPRRRPACRSPGGPCRATAASRTSLRSSGRRRNRRRGSGRAATVSADGGEVSDAMSARTPIAERDETDVGVVGDELEETHDAVSRSNVDVAGPRAAQPSARRACG